jgi:hypothetical protein
MERNVLSFRAALEKGYEPRLYSYDPARIPLGEMEAVLDFKTWSRRIIAINCYFTKAGTGEKFVLTVYGHPKTGRYTLPGSTLDFGQCPIHCSYNVMVERKGNDAKNKIVLVKAEPKIIRPDPPRRPVF